MPHYTSLDAGINSQQNNKQKQTSSSLRSSPSLNNGRFHSNRIIRFADENNSSGAKIENEGLTTNDYGAEVLENIIEGKFTDLKDKNLQYINTEIHNIVDTPSNEGSPVTSVRDDTICTGSHNDNPVTQHSPGCHARKRSYTSPETFITESLKNSALKKRAGGPTFLESYKRYSHCERSVLASYTDDSNDNRCFANGASLNIEKNITGDDSPLGTDGNKFHPLCVDSLTDLLVRIFIQLYRASLLMLSDASANL